VTVAAAAARHSRAALLVTVALVVAGAIAAFTLPSSIYPPLQFPRIVIIARSGTLPPQSMTLTVTRPIETAVMEVPGIRRVRSRSIRGAAEISAQFDPATDMVVALQQVQNRLAEARGELPSDLDLTVERLAHDHALDDVEPPTPALLRIAKESGFTGAVRFSTVFRELTGMPPTQYRREQRVRRLDDREHSKHA